MHSNMTLLKNFIAKISITCGFLLSLIMAIIFFHKNVNNKKYLLHLKSCRV